MAIFSRTIFALLIILLLPKKIIGNNHIFFPVDYLTQSDSIREGNVYLTGVFGLNTYTRYNLFDIIIGADLFADYTPSFKKANINETNFIFRPGIGFAVQYGPFMDNTQESRLFGKIEFLFKYRIIPYYIITGLGYYYCGDAEIRYWFTSKSYETVKFLQALNITAGLGYESDKYIYELKYYHPLSPTVKFVADAYGLGGINKITDYKFSFHITFNIGFKLGFF